VFYLATAFNGDLSTWQVGNVASMGSSTYTLSPPATPRSGLF
jgi:surface protein